MPQTEDKTRRQVAEFLPHAMAKALSSYQSFLESEIGENAKDFKAHHDACKVAIAHLELLIKLAQWADVPAQGDADVAHAEMLRLILSQAQEEIDGSAQD